MGGPLSAARPARRHDVQSSQDGTIERKAYTFSFKNRSLKKLKSQVCGQRACNQRSSTLDCNRAWLAAPSKLLTSSEQAVHAAVVQTSEKLTCSHYAHMART